MFKKLDKLIIRAFIGPFVATFFITLFVLVMQFFWLYIDEFVGKGISTGIIMKFIWYQSAVLVPLALPLAVLLSSLMTFGNLGESFELVAIKSAGISLLRFMRPLFIIAFFIACIAFLFSNSIIPVATLKSRTLLSDISNANPAFDLEEGVFYDKIPGFAVKIGKKEDNDSVIRDVIVYEQSNQSQDNFIIAKSGVMRITGNKRLLEFDLRDGWRYQERSNAYEVNNTEFVRIGFKEYKKQFDLSSFQIMWTNDSVNRNNEKMFSIRQLNVAIDSLSKDLEQTRQRLNGDINRMVSFAAIIDSAEKQPTVNSKATETTAKKFDDILPDSAEVYVNQQAQNLANSLRINAESFSSTLNDKERVLRRHKIEWHRKITLSLACLVLFLIGAPLGSIIRKGGLGTPLIFAIVFFLVFYFSNTTGEKFAKEGTLSPFMGMWMATFVLTPLGIFLTYKAMHDSHLFNKEFYYRIARFIRRTIGKKK